MKQFYSIVKLSPHVVTEDSVAVGIVFYDGELFRTYFSDYKINIAAKLNTRISVNVKQIVQEIAVKCEQLNLEKSKDLLINEARDYTHPSYFQYLSNYANGLIQFSSPVSFIGEMSDAYFAKFIFNLFNEDLEKTSIPKSTQQSNYEEIIHQKLIRHVEDKVHTNYSFSPEKSEDIYFSFEMECIGKNGALIGAKSMPFNKGKSTMDKYISHYFALISTLSNRYNYSLKQNSFYMISEEPKDIGSENHQLWEIVKNHPIIKVIHPEESGIVSDLIVRKKATTFLEG
jgi:hypothetical protein